MELTTDDYNFLCEHFALTTTPKMHDTLKKLGFDTVGDLAKYIEDYKIIKAQYGFLSGLLLGWGSALEDPKQVDRVIIDMNEMAKKLEEKAGIITEKKIE